MKKNLSKIIFFILLFVGCSQNKNSEQLTYQSVDLNLDTSKTSSPDVDSKQSVGEFGPGQSDVQTHGESKRKEVLGVFLGPGLYQSIEGLSVLECLERLDVDLHVVSGMGFGSIISLLYAQGESLQNIEWKLFKAMRKDDGAIFEKQWLLKWRHFLEKEVDLKKLKVSSKTAFLPIYDSRLKEVVLSNRFTIEEVFTTNFDLKNKHFHLKKDLFKDVLNKKKLVDKLIYVNFLNGEKIIKSRGEYLKGLFLKSYSLFQKNEKSDIITIDLSENFKIEDRHSSSRINKQKVCNQIRSAF